MRDVGPLAVELVGEPAERLLFRELVGRYHYLGHKVPFGAHLRYLVLATRPALLRRLQPLGVVVGVKAAEPVPVTSRRVLPERSEGTFSARSSSY